MKKRNHSIKSKIENSFIRNNIIYHKGNISKADRSKCYSQKPCILWFTGLSASGKSTIANEVESILFGLQKHSYLLDGDNIRMGLNKDLGFSKEDRNENIRRIGEVSKLFVDAGMIVLTAFISPFRRERDRVRELMEDGEFIEIFIDTPLAICESRDPKGLYKKAKRGEIPDFTGIDSPYESPYNPEIHIDNHHITAEEAAMQVLDYLVRMGYI